MQKRNPRRKRFCLHLKNSVFISHEASLWYLILFFIYSHFIEFYMYLVPLFVSFLISNISKWFFFFILYCYIVRQSAYIVAHYDPNTSAKQWLPKFESLGALHFSHCVILEKNDFNFIYLFIYFVSLLIKLSTLYYELIFCYIFFFDIILN